MKKKTGKDLNLKAATSSLISADVHDRIKLLMEPKQKKKDCNIKGCFIDLYRIFSLLAIFASKF